MATCDLLKSDYAAQTIEQWIRSGRLVAGQKMPSERALAKELGISHLTVRRGLEALVQRGAIAKRPRVGNFVESLPTVKNIALVVHRYMLHGGYRHPVLPVMLHGVTQALDHAGYNILPISYSYGQLTRELLPLIRDRRIDGALLCISNQVTRQEIRELLDTGVPLVSLNESTRVADLLPCVYVAWRHAILPTLEKLAELGHRDIRFCQYSHSSGRAQDVALLAEGLRAYGLGTMDRCQVTIPNANGVPDFSVLAKALDERPTAMVVPDEFAASEIFRLCHRRHLRIPDDLSLVAQSNIMPGTQPVPLSCMDTYTLTDQAASYAATLLAAMVNGQRAPSYAAAFHSPMQWTESVGPCPSR